MKYFNIREEELKNKIAQDFFDKFVVKGNIKNIMSILLTLIIYGSSIFAEELPRIKPRIDEKPNIFTKSEQEFSAKVLAQAKGLRLDGGRDFFFNCRDGSCMDKERMKEEFEKGYYNNEYYKDECLNKSFEECYNNICRNCDVADKILNPFTDDYPSCSWYCSGGGIYKLTASSNIEDYIPESIHDFNLFTAWIPENKGGKLERFLDRNKMRYIYRGGAIGEKINIHARAERNQNGECHSPHSRITNIIIWNGYLKNIELWRKYSRVKELKLIINGEPTAILELENITNAQSFNIDAVRATCEQELVITLEIMDIFKGDKYDDVAISEINFSGLDVH